MKPILYLIEITDCINLNDLAPIDDVNYIITGFPDTSFKCELQNIVASARQNIAITISKAIRDNTLAPYYSNIPPKETLGNNRFIIEVTGFIEASIIQHNNLIMTKVLAEAVGVKIIGDYSRDSEDKSQSLLINNLATGSGYYWPLTNYKQLFDLANRYKLVVDYNLGLVMQPMTREKDGYGPWERFKSSSIEQAVLEAAYFTVMETKKFRPTITIHYDFTDGSEISYAKGIVAISMCESFTTNCLDFMSTEYSDSYKIIVLTERGSYIDVDELLDNNGVYTAKNIREEHNLHKMLKAGVFSFVEPANDKKCK